MKLYSFPKLNKNQLNRLSEILGNAGLLFLGTLILPMFIGGSYSPFIVLSGLVLSGGSMFLSLYFIRM